MISVSEMKRFQSLFRLSSRRSLSPDTEFRLPAIGLYQCLYHRGRESLLAPELSTPWSTVEKLDEPCSTALPTLRRRLKCESASKERRFPPPFVCFRSISPVSTHTPFCQLFRRCRNNLTRPLLSPSSVDLALSLTLRRGMIALE